MSNIDWFKYSWIWDRVNLKTGFLNAKIMPIRVHEDICVFYKDSFIYNPIMTFDGKPYKLTTTVFSENYGAQRPIDYDNDGSRFPITIIKIKGDRKKEKGLHPTQKPVALFEYLIKTYTNEGDLVLDNCAGSGTTAIACIKNNRDYILIEKEKEYINIINERIKYKDVPRSKRLADWLLS
jgi:site-specific DNA-methyltransferase (adenine-specific)